MSDMIILVTGSTDGIGKAAAYILALEGHHVLLHGRNPKKGEDVKNELADRSGSDDIDLFIADLSVPEQIRTFARTIGDSFDRLDVLINNAGVFMPRRTVTPSGIETTLAVNFCAPFLLTHELLPLLTRASSARIVNTASDAHSLVKEIPWDALPTLEQYDPYDAYALSQLGVVVFTLRLAGLLGGPRITANCLHPGVINTKLMRSYDSSSRGSPPEVGGALEVYLATSPEVRGVSGRYYEKDTFVSPSVLSRDPAVQEKFWEKGLEWTGLEEFRIP